MILAINRYFDIKNDTVGKLLSREIKASPIVTYSSDAYCEYLNTLNIQSVFFPPDVGVKISKNAFFNGKLQYGVHFRTSSGSGFSVRPQMKRYKVSGKPLSYSHQKT